MSQKDNDSGEIAIDNFTELTQLVKSTLQTVKYFSLVGLTQ